VAHWYVRRPDVPGRSWGGRGWTFWQWSATGRVPGIRGPVDLDWFEGRDIAAGTIASLSVTPAAGGAINGPMVECGAGRMRCGRLANPSAPITLRATPGPGTRLLRWTGDCAPAGAARTCRLTARGKLEVSAVFERASGAASPAVPMIGSSGPPPGARHRHRHCRPLDIDCTIAAFLSRGLGTHLGKVLPALLAEHGREIGTEQASSHARGR
jgi:hypothetical protein